MSELKLPAMPSTELKTPADIKEDMTSVVVPTLAVIGTQLLKEFILPKAQAYGMALARAYMTSGTKLSPEEWFAAIGPDTSWDEQVAAAVRRAERSPLVFPGPRKVTAMDIVVAAQTDNIPLHFTAEEIRAVRLLQL